MYKNKKGQQHPGLVPSLRMAKNYGGLVPDPKNIPSGYD